MNNQDVSAVLIVLNNAENVQLCLESIKRQRLNRIIVVDGGSTDGTLDIVRKFGSELYEIGKTGLAHSRQFGADKVGDKYVLFVDSDNILDDSCVTELKRYFEENKFVGVAAQKRAYQRNNYFCRFQEWMNSKKINQLGEKLVVGTPALYDTDIVKKVRYDVAATMGDDTDFCYRLRLNGHLVGTGPGICYERMQDTLNGFYSKALLYGRADSQFFLKHKERRWNIGTHVLRNYFAKMLFCSLVDLRPQFLPLVFLYSFCRAYGLYATVLRKIVCGKKA